MHALRMALLVRAFVIRACAALNALRVLGTHACVHDARFVAQPAPICAQVVLPACETIYTWLVTQSHAGARTVSCAAGIITSSSGWISMVLDGVAKEYMREATA